MAPPLKRKRDVVDNEDDEEPSLGRQVLPVANLPPDFDGVPLDGLEYLFTVRYFSNRFGVYDDSLTNIHSRRDAKLLPRVTRVPNPYEIQEKSVPVKVEGEATSGLQSYIPSQEWQDTFLRRFKNFRQVSLDSVTLVHDVFVLIHFYS